jgi:hypothetical protein
MRRGALVRRGDRSKGCNRKDARIESMIVDRERNLGKGEFGDRPRPTRGDLDFVAAISGGEDKSLKEVCFDVSEGGGGAELDVDTADFRFDPGRFAGG